MGNIGLQLYSIREMMQLDFIGTIKKVAQTGYKGVEFAGYFGMVADDVKKILEDSGLEVAGSHDGIDYLKKDPDMAIAYALAIGNKNIICPYLPVDMRNSSDAYKKTAEIFNEIGEKCLKSGIRFGYHNHNFEFEMFDGCYGLDILMKNTQKELVFVELDTYWVEFSGLKPVDFIHKYKERCPLLHIKEMKSAEEKINTIIGKGIMDFKSIVSAGEKYNVDWYIVEQEYFEADQMQSVQQGLDYLESIM